MPVVLKRFRERNEDMKLYKPGDPYSYGDQERIDYLVSQGFLSPDDQSPEDQGTPGSDTKLGDPKNETSKNSESGDVTTGADDPAQGADSESSPPDVKDKSEGGRKKKTNTPDAG